MLKEIIKRLKSDQQTIAHFQDYQETTEFPKRRHGDLERWIGVVEQKGHAKKSTKSLRDIQKSNRFLDISELGLPCARATRKKNLVEHKIKKPPGRCYATLKKLKTTLCYSEILEGGGMLSPSKNSK